jgi:GT2 family glycosyltransferase
VTELVSIVILTHNRRGCLAVALAHLGRLSDPRHEVIVVDNGSTDGTADLVAQRHPRVRCLRLAENRGVGARNRGLQEARGGIVVCLDDDVVGIDDADLDFLRRRFASAPDLGALAFQVRDERDGHVCDWVHHRRLDEAGLVFETYEITEGAVAFRREALARAGWYREDYFLSHEGLDLAYRLMDAGYRLEYDGTVAVRHRRHAGGRASWRRHYYDTRNLFWVAVRHQPWPYALRYLTRGLAAMAVYALRDGHWLPWLRAVHAGLERVPELLRERTPWTPATAELCRRIDAARPGFWYLARRRLLQRGFKMD